MEVLLVVLFLQLLVSTSPTQGDWIKIPKVTPPTKPASTTPTSREDVLRRVSTAPTAITRISASIPEVMMQSPFSPGYSPGYMDTSHYYRWRNRSDLRIMHSPTISERVDFSMAATDYKEQEVSSEEKIEEDEEDIESPFAESPFAESPFAVSPQRHPSTTTTTTTVIPKVTDKFDSDSEDLITVDDEDVKKESGSEEDEADELDESYEILADEDDSESEDKVPPKVSGGPFSGLLEFLKGIQDRFTFKSARSVGDKVKVLKDFSDSMLINIQNRISTLFSKKKRTKRTILSGGHDSVDFPSAEGALMTISFLTFAVFLIKLVLQVINTIKSKHFTYNSMMPADASLAAIKVIKRHRSARKLSLSEEDDLRTTANVLSAIHK